MDYEINLTLLNSKLSDFEQLKNDVDKIYNNFDSSYINTMNSSELSSIKSNISQSITRLKNSYTNSSNWLNNYIKDLTALEDSLSSFQATGLTEILEFKGEFNNIFSKVTIPALIAKKTITTDEDTNMQFTIGEGGEFVVDESKGIYGYFVSSIDGKKHIIYNQSQISGWSGDCNRAALASIVSAYEANSWDAVNLAKKCPNGLGYKSKVTNDYLANFGLSADVKDINGSYDSVKNNIIKSLSSGDYVMFDLPDPHVKGQSGQTWTSTRHWLAILDIKKTGSGPNDYSIFISDSGRRGRAGWYSINEFSGQRIQNFTTVTNTMKKE